MKKVLFALILAVLAAAGAGQLLFGGAPVTDRPPALTVACGEEETAAWLGGYQWSWPEGESARSAAVDAPHPLDVMDDLPVIHGKPGDELVLAFEGVPDKADVICYWVDGKDLTVCPMGDLSSASRLILPENCSGTLWIVNGKWETGECTGRAEYAFFIQ